MKNLSTGEPWNTFATTGESGILSFTLKNAPSGCYTTSLDSSMIPSGFSWDGVYPDTRHNLRSDCTPFP